MTIIADTSYHFALYNSRDTNHRAAAKFAFETASERMLLPEVALAELGYLLVRDLAFAQAGRQQQGKNRGNEIQLLFVMVVAALPAVGGCGKSG